MFSKGLISSSGSSVDKRQIGSERRMRSHQHAAHRDALPDVLPNIVREPSHMNIVYDVTTNVTAAADRGAGVAFGNRTFRQYPVDVGANRIRPGAEGSMLTVVGLPSQRCDCQVGQGTSQNIRLKYTIYLMSMMMISSRS